MNPTYLPGVIQGQTIDLSSYTNAKLVAENSIYKFYQCDNSSIEFTVLELIGSPKFLSSAICEQEDGENAAFIMLGK